MIEIKDLTKQYGKLTAVDNLTLSIPAGEIFGFIGPNGAGKTTTISMIAGLLAPTSGSVEICGIDMLKEPKQAKQNIGYIPDRPYIYEKLTAIEFLQFTADLFSMTNSMTKEEFRQRAESQLKIFSLLDWADALIESFSHGMKQRLIMAAALIHEPKVLVVDEPMVGLDPSAIKMVKQMLIELADSGTTIFMSTHTLKIAEDVCDRIGVIHKGRLIAKGSVKELKQQAVLKRQAKNQQHENGDNVDLEQLFMMLTESEQI
ncbi:MAG: ABC transporter ATP-binding protein [Desulfamplus sp.]|nr:ABC transporter ATP-binding protein [Desulfamplus sp.]